MNTKDLNRIDRLLDILILIGSIVLVLGISLEILTPLSDHALALMMQLQLGICLLFLFDFFFRLATSEHPWRYFFRNWLLLLVSIPYANIAYHAWFTDDSLTTLFLKLIPFIRGAYGIVIVIGWITKSSVTNLMVSYIFVLASLIWFSALIFYTFEAHINSAVTDFWSALWWSMMLATTVGSSIEAVTVIGQILSVGLALTGMMVFPIFTVYITDKLQHTMKAQKDSSTTKHDSVG